MTQLQQQALTQIACANTGGLELLDAVQNGLDLVEFDIQFGIEGFEDFFKGFLKVTLGVHAIDQGDRDQADRCRTSASD